MSLIFIEGKVVVKGIEVSYKIGNSIEFDDVDEIGALHRKNQCKVVCIFSLNKQKYFRVFRISNEMVEDVELHGIIAHYVGSDIDKYSKLS